MPEHRTPPTDAPVPLRNLSPREAAFVREYLLDPDTRNAAIRAGYAPANAGVQGRCLLRRPHVAAAIQRARVQVQEQTTVDVGWIVSRLAVEATGTGPDTSSAARVAACRELARLLGFGPDGAARPPATVVNVLSLSADDLAAARELARGILPAAERGQGAAIELSSDHGGIPDRDRSSQSILANLASQSLPGAGAATTGSGVLPLGPDCAEGGVGVGGGPSRIFLTEGEPAPPRIFFKSGEPDTVPGGTEVEEKGVDIVSTPFLGVVGGESLEGGE